jgi:hypothetical protein
MPSTSLARQPPTRDPQRSRCSSPGPQEHPKPNISRTPYDFGLIDATLDVLDETIHASLSPDEVDVFVDFLERTAARSQRLLNRST